MKNKVNQTAQQGDVILRKSELPTGAKAVAHTDLVLAEGETTGHAHRIRSVGSEMFEFRSRLFIKLIEPSLLLHEEHKPILLDEGIWEIGKVQEFDYLSQMVRPVRD